MSETKGRLGWMTEKGVQLPPGTWGVRDIKSALCTEPVYVLPLDPDDPKPGDRMSWCGREVEVVGAPWSTKGGVRLVVARDESTGAYRGRHDVYEVKDLSPIPRTRTVTVELDEEEAKEARRWADLYKDHGAGVDKIMAKIGAALKDTE